MNVAILTSVAVNSRHGTGVQILRIFDDSEFHLLNFYWSDRAGLTDLSIDSHLLSRFGLLRKIFGKEVVRFINFCLPFKWWNGNVINFAKLTRLLKKNKYMKFDAAYVVPANEEDCLRMSSILKVLDCSYIVHMMDLCHDNGINPAKMPGYSKLLKSAKIVLVTSDPMYDEVQKFKLNNIYKVCLGKNIVKKSKYSSTNDNKIRIVILGSVGEKDNPGLSILEEAVLSLDNDSQFEFIYMGQHYNYFSDFMKKKLIYYRNLSLSEFEEYLSKMHIAYLPYPYKNDCYARFAPLGKLVDMFMAGLPIIYFINTNSCAYKHLSKYNKNIVRYVDSKSDFLKALYFFSDQKNWNRSSYKLRRLAEEIYNINNLKRVVFNSISASE